jgi:SAM-dependent methyltransferase
MHEGAPSAWVKRFASLIPAGARVLDVACGSGRHARFLSSMGHQVEAVDRDPEVLASLQALPGITTRTADLEAAAWPYEGACFEAVIVANYLHRARFSALLELLAPSGVLIYETFMAGNEQLGRPFNPDFLLQPGELLERVQGKLTVVAFEQGRIETPRPAFLQRICAVAAGVGALPA